MKTTTRELQSKTLRKTSIKGLFLTIEDKAWHKSAKREIPTTANGKIRFNGKMYDLQKLLIETTPNTGLEIKKSVSIRELQKQGFRKTKIRGLYITNKGLCYNSITKRSLAIRNGKTAINGKTYNVAKIILETFCKIPIRSGQITFKNGNHKDFFFENLEYTSTIKQLAPSETDIIQCIRLYFEVDKTLNKKSSIAKYFLYQIVIIRGFNLKHKGIDFDLFIEYLKTEYYFLSNNQKNVFENFGYTATNGKNAINKYLNLLVWECLEDFEKGLLKTKDFKPKPITKTQKLKELQKKVNDSGLDIKIPLRKLSTKEILNKYQKQTKI